MNRFYVGWLHDDRFGTRAVVKDNFNADAIALDPGSPAYISDIFRVVDALNNRMLSVLACDGIEEITHLAKSIAAEFKVTQ